MTTKFYLKERNRVINELFDRYKNVVIMRLQNELGTSVREEIAQLLIKEYGISIVETQFIFKSLLKEGYIDSIEPLEISIKGITLKKYGGFYARQFRRAVAIIGSVAIFIFTAIPFFMPNPNDVKFDSLHKKLDSLSIKNCEQVYKYHQQEPSKKLDVPQRSEKIK